LFQHNTPDFVSSQEWKPHKQISIYYIIQFGIPCNNLSAKNGVNHLQTQRSSECYLRQMAWCCHQTARIRKAI